MDRTKNNTHTRSIQVLYNGALAGILKKSGKRYSFTYTDEYMNGGHRPISITMPLRNVPYESDLLFPIFANLLSEGVNKKMQCRMLKIDENDYFGLLLATAREDSIGPLTIKEIKHAS